MAQLATETNRSSERRLPMTYEDFLASDVSESHAEWVDGEVIVFMPPNERHHDIVVFLHQVLSLLLRRTGAGKALIAPFEMRLGPRSSREPDLLFVSKERLDRMDGQRLEGPADLAVEVISRYSVARDRADKFYEYQQAGVLEYIVIDPRAETERVDSFRLGADGRFLPVLPDADGRYHFSSVPGFWIEEGWLWQDPLPDPIDVLSQIAPQHFGALKRALE